MAYVSYKKQIIKNFLQFEAIIIPIASTHFTMCVCFWVGVCVCYFVWKLNFRIDLMLQTNLPVFRVKESSVRRRYSDFEWLRNELERDSKIVVPPLPSKAIKRQLPFRSDDGIYEEGFIEDRRSGLEAFVNK